MGGWIRKSHSDAAKATVVSTMFRTFVGGSLIRSQAAASSGSGLEVPASTPL
jgi:hypothetical protein